MENVIFYAVLKKKSSQFYLLFIWIFIFLCIVFICSNQLIFQLVHLLL